MTTSTKASQKTESARAELLERGATLEKREDAHGDTKTGWWMDGVWLAPTNKPVLALASLDGN